MLRQSDTASDIHTKLLNGVVAPLEKENNNKNSRDYRNKTIVLAPSRPPQTDL